MQKAIHHEKNIIREEKVGYLKSTIQLFPGRLCLTSEKLTLISWKQGVSGVGIIGTLAKIWLEKEKTIFSLDLTEIQSVSLGSHKFQKNILQISDKYGNCFRIVVQNFEEWEAIIQLQKLNTA